MSSFALWLGVAAPVAALIVATFLAYKVLSLPSGTPIMVDIARAIQQGARAYLARQYTTISLVAIGLFLILYFALGPITALGFLVGAVLSALAGYVGMMVSVRANVRTAQASYKGLPSAFKTAFYGGSVTGLIVVSLALVAVSIFYIVFGNISALVGLGFGASLISVFARLGGGIYTKGADVGADLVGKLEAGIPEDDPRNPAVIADNVGDNVGDCAGMAADLFETYVVTAVAAMVLASLLFASEKLIIYPLVLGAVSILASVLSIFLVKIEKGTKNIMSAFYRGLFANAVLAAGGFYLVSRFLLGNEPSVSWLNLFLSSLVGLAVTALKERSCH